MHIFAFLQSSSSDGFQYSLADFLIDSIREKLLNHPSKNDWVSSKQENGLKKSSILAILGAFSIIFDDHVISSLGLDEVIGTYL